MEVKLEKRYPLTVDADSAWRVLRDVKATAECMPGASITEQLDATHYKGAVKVKVGPASAAFAGDIEVLALDEGARKLQLLGKGADRGGSSASMDLTATVEPGHLADISVLVGRAAVIVNGKFAQFGGRMMMQVSDMLLAQFADNFREAATAMALAPRMQAVPAQPAIAESPAKSTVAAAKTPTTATGEPPKRSLEATPITNPSCAPPSEAAVATKPSAKQSEINGLAIVWQLIKGLFAGLFGKRPA